MTAVPEIQMIATNAIDVLNPRARNKRVFQELVTSIANLGLKKPITVSPAPHGSRFDLSGEVLEGPAERPLPSLPVRMEATGLSILLNGEGR